MKKLYWENDDVLCKNVEKVKKKKKIFYIILYIIYHSKKVK